MPRRDDLRSGLRGVLSGTRALDDWALARLQRRGRGPAPAPPPAPAVRPPAQRGPRPRPAAARTGARAAVPAAAGRPTVLLLEPSTLDELDLELAAEFPDFPDDVAPRPARRWPRGARDLVLPVVLLSEFLAGVVIGIIT